MPADDDRSEVLTSLPRSRPQRRSAKRGGDDAGPSADGGAPASTRGAAGAKPRAAKVAAAAAKAPGAPTAAPPAAAKGKAAPRSRSRPVGAGAGSDDSPAVEPPSSADVLESAVRAAGELAQVGATIGRHTVKSVLRRLRP